MSAAFGLAMEFDGATMGVIAGVGIAVLGVVYFGIRFWLVSTRPPAISDVPTPKLDQLNRQALEHMAEVTREQDEAETSALQEEDSPTDLKSAIPGEEPEPKK